MQRLCIVVRGGDASLFFDLIEATFQEATLQTWTSENNYGDVSCWIVESPNAQLESFRSYARWKEAFPLGMCSFPLTRGAVVVCRKSASAIQILNTGTFLFHEGPSEDLCVFEWEPESTITTPSNLSFLSVCHNPEPTERVPLVLEQEIHFSSKRLDESTIGDVIGFLKGFTYSRRIQWKREILSIYGW
jgi:hypothetical protein